MITSNEPGVYIENKFGIRLENEILCTERKDGRYEFETITFCPFEREAILPELLTETEKAWLNAYHARVYDTPEAAAQHRRTGLAQSSGFRDLAKFIL